MSFKDIVDHITDHVDELQKNGDSQYIGLTPIN